MSAASEAIPDSIEGDDARKHRALWSASGPDLTLSPVAGVDSRNEKFLSKHAMTSLSAPVIPFAHRRSQSALAALAVRPILLLIAAKSALNLAFASRYGWQRDELYYAVAGHHLQGGYVEFPPVTALVSALARELFGSSLTGLRLFAILAGAGAAFVAALIAREVGGGRRAQLIATVAVGFSPLLISMNGLFQPVSFDELTTLLLLWLALRLALGRGSWLALGVVAGVGLETKYTIAVVVALVVAGFLAFRRDVLNPLGLLVAAGIAGAIMVPNLVWEAGHKWISVHWFLNPPASASDESRFQFIGNIFLLTHVVAVPVAVAGVVLLWRRAALRPLAIVPPVALVAYFALGGKSYYALPVVMFALACGAVTFDRWASRTRLCRVAIAFFALLVVMLPIGLPVLPLKTADSLGILKARSDYQDEVGWPQLAANVERFSSGKDVVLTRNYGEAGALLMFGRPSVSQGRSVVTQASVDAGSMPPVASGHVTFQFWRPDVQGRRALLVGFRQPLAQSFCHDYRVLAHVQMPVANEERGREIASCVLNGSLASVWPNVLALYQS
jgi:Dolichyl-phosphate-mannose-protein mannosyltransferase